MCGDGGIVVLLYLTDFTYHIPFQKFQVKTIFFSVAFGLSSIFISENNLRTSWKRSVLITVFWEIVVFAIGALITEIKLTIS